MLVQEGVHLGVRPVVHALAHRARELDAPLRACCSTERRETSPEWQYAFAQSCMRSRTRAREIDAPLRFVIPYFAQGNFPEWQDACAQSYMRSLTEHARSMLRLVVRYLWRARRCSRFPIASRNTPSGSMLCAQSCMRSRTRARELDAHARGEEGQTRERGSSANEPMTPAPTTRKSPPSPPNLSKPLRLCVARRAGPIAPAGGVVRVHAAHDHAVLEGVHRDACCRRPESSRSKGKTVGMTACMSSMAPG